MTNIVVIEVTAGISAQEVSDRLRQEGVLINAIRPTALRAVTNLNVPSQDIDRAVEVFAKVAKGLR